MKKILIILIILLLGAGLTYSQRAKILTQAVTPQMLKSAPFIQDSTVALGLSNVANKTWVYVSVINTGDNSQITNAVWTFVSKPAGSSSTLSTLPSLGWWAKFRPDVNGTYQVKVTMTTSTGTRDTTKNIYAANYVGAGGFDGVPAQLPNCMSCHAYTGNFPAIFNKWKVSGHARWFKYNIDSGSASYGISCIKCHTTGYDRNIVADNGGFDDKARQLGWAWSNYSPPKPGNWDSLKTRFPSLVAFASVGCESCHGPGGEHVQFGDTNKISISYKAETCGSCHDALRNHVKNDQWKNSPHSQVIWSSSFAQAPSNPAFGTNNLGNCIRCHDGRGYVNFSYGRGTNTQGMIQSSQEMISCQACHDPHGGPNAHQLRTRPANSDTLANGFHYAGGNAKVCLDCHKSRTNNVALVQTKVNSQHWGPHGSTQGDVVLGQNAANFGVPYISGSHKNIGNLCVTCHMAEGTDTGTVTWNKVGEHTFRVRDEEHNYDNVKGCLGSGCHSGVNNFDDFMAPQDFDGDSQTESWQHEVEGCIRNLRIALPPAGVDSVSWQLIAADSFNVNLRKAYFNYQMIVNDGSRGMHNPFYVIQVLLSSIAPIGVEPLGSEVPNRYEISQNYPNPFNPTTKINFSIPRAENVSIKIYDITGKEVYELVNSKLQPGKYSVTWVSINSRNEGVSSGVYFYRIIAGDFVESKKMILVR
jgi:hypothetical protein